MRMLRPIAIALALVVVAGFAAKHVLLDMGDVPARSSYALDIARVRALALSGEGALPLRINSELVASSSVPAVARLAGESVFERVDMVRTAYQVVYPEGHGVILDTGTDRALHEELSPPGPFYPERYAAVQRAMLAADAIVITHEHPDHIGGITSSPNLEQIQDKLVLTRPQVESRELLERVHYPFTALRDVVPLDYQDLHRLRRGFVLIAAPGHTPGNQMVFVRLHSGVEYLFVGDVTWHMDGIRLPRASRACSSAAPTTRSSF
jgi:glyoxylase-like metal-dependent hydrolase (beta-lactamase superfamily II)